MTRMLIVLRIFANVSEGVRNSDASAPSIIAGSPNNSKAWMYAFVEVISAIAKNGKIITLTNLEKWDLV